MVPKMLVAVTALTIMGGLVAASGYCGSLDLKTKGVLQIGLEGTYPPFNFVNDKNQLDGYDVDVAKEIAKKLNVKADFVTTEWSGLIAGLQASKYDIVVNQVTITAERKKSLDFTIPYTVSGAQIIVRKGETRFKKLEDLKGYSVGVGLGSNYEKVARSVDGVKVKTYSGSSEYLADLVAGRIEAALNDRLMTAWNVTKSGLPVKGAGKVLDTENQAIALRKGSGLTEEINKALEDLKKDGTLAKISIKWFGEDVTE